MLVSGETNAEAYAAMSHCQSELHTWGHANGVVFDASKESMRILSHSRPHGDGFRSLGVVFDCKLLMGDAISECACEAGWRSRSILHCRRYYSVRELIFLYKSHILSYIEYRTAAISHASSSALSVIESVQHMFLRALEVSDESALIDYGLAPLSVRRDIAILGIIHRSIIGQGPPMFAHFFRLSLFLASSRPFRFSAPAHNRQLRDSCNVSSPDYVLRSPLGGVRLYNILPQAIVHQTSVHDFQQCLQAFLCSRIRAGDAQWRTLLSWRQPFAFHPLLAHRVWTPT